MFNLTFWHNLNFFTSQFYGSNRLKMSKNLKSKSAKIEAPKHLKCTIEGCDAAFAKNRALINHVRKHTGEVASFFLFI